MKKCLIKGRHSSEEFSNALLQYQNDPSVNSVLILAAYGTSYAESDYNPILSNTPLQIIGGIFPEIVYEGQRYNEGTILVGFEQKINTLTLDKFDDEDWVLDQLEGQFGDVRPENKSIFIFVDALIQNKSSIFDGLYNAYGTIPKYIGAGTGSLDFNTFPSVFSNKGMLTSSAVIGIIDLDATVGVAHGWESISEPLKVTEAVDNQIKTLNWKPAMEVYQEIVEKHSKKEFDHSDFYNTIRSYPLGIAKLDSEMVVRDPFKQEEGVVYTLDNVEQGSHVKILYGNMESLLEGAVSANKRAIPAGKDNSNADLFLIDCISRVLYMNDEYSEELKRLDPSLTGFGALTLGEIANNGDSYLEVFNKTAVVCAIHG